VILRVAPDAVTTTRINVLVPGDVALATPRKISFIAQDVAGAPAASHTAAFVSE
jgi:hypothetical protein